MTEKEIWKPVAGYEGLYLVSDAGRLMSESKLVPCKNGRAFRMTGKILNPGSGKSKYLSFRLVKHGMATTRYVQRIVLEAFVSACPPGMEACHGDGDRQNNRIDNLRWGTRKSNHADKNLHGTMPRGVTHPRAKLDDAVVLSMRNFRNSGASYRVIAEAAGVTTMTAYRAINRQNWSHIS